MVENARLSRGLVFDDEIAAEKEYGQKFIWHNFRGREGSKAASNYWNAEVKEEHDNKKEPSGYESGIKDRAE